MEDHSFFVGGIFEQGVHLNSDVIVGILVLFLSRVLSAFWLVLVTLCNVSGEPSSHTIAHVT